MAEAKPIRAAQWVENAAVGRVSRGIGRRYNDLKLITKTVFSVGCIMLLMAAVSAAYFVSEHYLAEQRTIVDKAYQRLAQTANVESEMTYTHRLLRNALLLADADQIRPYNSQLQRYDDAMSALRVLSANDPQQLERLRRVDALMAQWQASFAAPAVEALLDAPRRQALREDAQAVRDMAVRSIPAMDAARSVLIEMSGADHGLVQEAQSRMDDAIRFSDIVVLSAWGIGCFLMLLWLRLTRTGLGEPLATLTELIPRLSAGETELEIPHQDRRDEVGGYARALVELRQVVAVRDADNWVKTEVADISGAVQECLTHEQFADTFLRLYCAATGAAFAVAYRWDEDRELLLPCGSFALPDQTFEERSIKPGEGWIGQAYLEQRTLCFEAVPHQYFHVRSGLGSAPPATVLVLPLIARGEVVAVIELAYLGTPAARVQALTGALIEVVALSWQTLARSLRTLELLRTTSAQAEELRSSEEAMRIQQEELRSTNETLRDRTQLLEEQKRRLRASEEELRAQAEELRVTNVALTERGETLRQRQEEVEHAHAELEKRALELERASRYKSEFLANMSHELRTPLNSLLILSKGLADNEDRNLNDDQIESARIIYDSGVSLLNLINDILDLSKVEAGKMQLNLEDVSLAAFASGQERNFRHVATSRGLNFEVQLMPGLPDFIHSDGTRLGQIVTNLLSNSFKFTQQGGVTLIIGRPSAASTLRMPGLDASKAIYFAVSDTGIGISNEKIDKIFNPFEQADGSTSRRFGGTGLGLSIVRGMAQLLGGEVQVQSEEGVGSVFMLIVPERLEDNHPNVVRSATPSASRPAFTHAAPKVSSESGALPVARSSAEGEPSAAQILIVEDDTAFANVLAGIAAKKGTRTRIVSTGAEALAVARSEAVAGVLLDLGLPDMTGWQVLEALKAQPETRHIPVHIISANDESSRGLAMGAVGFLVKPATREGVLGALDRVAHFGDGRRRRLLIIDDDAGSRTAVRRLLEAENVDIVESADGLSALAALRSSEAFDCVILDLGLPDISGFEWLERASQQQAEMPPVVIYSGRELTPDESMRLREYTESIVIKGARSPERLLDEVSLFLHAIQKPAAAPVAPAVTPDAPAADVAGKTVLVVDDDMRNVFALSKALRGRGLKVLMAQDGFKALAQLESHPEVDIVLMDIMMPGMDGYETIRRVRAQSQWERVPIIAVTAKAMKGDREKCVEAGASDYCSKPIDIDQLMSQIRVWV